MAPWTMEGLSETEWRERYKNQPASGDPVDYRAESLAAFKTFREKHGSRRNDDSNEEERGRMLKAQRQQILERINK